MTSPNKRAWNIIIITKLIALKPIDDGEHIYVFESTICLSVLGSSPAGTDQLGVYCMYFIYTIKIKVFTIKYLQQEQVNVFF